MRLPAGVTCADAATYERVGLVNVVPDRSRRMSELLFNPVKLTAFQDVSIAPQDPALFELPPGYMRRP